MQPPSSHLWYRERPPHPEPGLRACGPGDASFPSGEARFLPGQMGGTESLHPGPVR